MPPLDVSNMIFNTTNP